MALDVETNADLLLGLMDRGGMLGIVLGCLRGLGRILGMGSNGGIMPYYADFASQGTSIRIHVLDTCSLHMQRWNAAVVWKRCTRN